jgi:hypothetical protein
LFPSLHFFLNKQSEKKNQMKCFKNEKEKNKITLANELENNPHHVQIKQ